MVSAAIGSDPQPIGARLVRAGKITASQLDRARGMQNAGDGRRLGDILVGLGAISRRELDRQLKAQIEEAVFELLRWTEGYFRFEEGTPCHAAVEAPVRFPTEALLMEAARRLDEWSRIGSKVSHLGWCRGCRRPDQQGGDRSTWCPSSGRCSPRWTASATCTRSPRCSGRSEFEVARTVYGLTTAGVVVLGRSRRTPGEEPEPGRDLAALLVPAREALAQGQYEIAAGALEELLRRDPLMPEARRLLGVCHAALGRFAEALETWDVWSRLGPRTPGEESETPSVERMRRAVETMLKELERYRD